MTERGKWFLDKIGKRIFRTENGCDCSVCKDVFENGLIVKDAMHADYLFTCECESAEIGEIRVRYFETIEERNAELSSRQFLTG